MGKTKSRSNGEGTIYNNGTRWVGQVTIGRDPTTGKLKRKSFYGKTQREVKEKIADALNKLNTNSYIEETEMTVGEWAEYWLENFKKHQITETTYVSYQYHITNHIIKPFGYIPLKKLSTLQIQEYVNGLKADEQSSSFIWWIYNKLDMMFKQAIKLDMLYKNPCHGVVLPKSSQKQPARALTTDEQKKLVDYCSSDLRKYIFVFQLGTGMRIGETLGLPWSSIDFEDNIIHIRQKASEIKGKAFIDNNLKTQSSIRDVPISPKIKDLLMEIYNSQDHNLNTLDLVFPTGKYTIISQANLRRSFDKILIDAGIEHITIHDLRHTFATRMLEKNVNIKVLSELLGHKNINITMNTYSHVLNDLKKSSIGAIDDFI